MRRLALGCIALFFIVFACSLMRGQTAIYDCYNGSSEQGGNNAVTNGIQSTNFVQQSFPGATVTVFLHNSATKASIFSDEFGLNALANPFSSSNHGVAFICAADGRYDIQYSNAGIASPYTVSDIRLCFSCTGGGGGSGSSFKTVPNCSAAPTVLNETVQEASQTVAGSTQTCATVGATSSTSIIGLCTSAGVCGSTGNAAVATQNTANCIFDNAATQGDYVVPSTSVTGWCSDAGAVKPSSAVETLGNVFQANTGGSGTIGVVQVAPLSLLLPGATGNTGVITPCTGTGCVAYFPNANQALIQGDTQFTTNGAGVFTALGGQFVDTSHSGEWFTQKGPALPALNATNAMYWATGTSFGTTYGLEPFDSAPTAGDCVSIIAGDAANWFKLKDSGAACAAGGGTVQAQTNGVNNANCTGSSCPLINATSSNLVAASNPSGGNWQWTLVGHTQVSTPTAPTLTVNGTTGSTQYCYAVVAVEDRTWASTPAFHTPLSGITCTSSGNATLSSTNSITLSAYIDTDYGANGAIVCRTTGGATQGILTGLLTAGKKFIDTGLTGDGTNCSTAFTTNTTDLVPNSAALPGCNILNDYYDGPDAPPCTPNALDDEARQTFGAPADVNDPFWAWGGGGTSACVQNSATAVWTSGTLVLTTDSTAAFECLEFTLPSTPYTFKFKLSALAVTNTSANEMCAVGFRESSTGKIWTAEIMSNQSAGTNTTNGGNIWATSNWTTNAAQTPHKFLGYSASNAYITVQNTGTNLVANFSDISNGVAFFSPQFDTETVGTGFTTAPNQLVFGGYPNGGTPIVCTLDFERRTQ